MSDEPESHSHKVHRANQVHEDMKDFQRERAFSRWERRGGPGPVERVWLAHPYVAMVAAGLSIGLFVVVLMMAVTRSVTVLAVIGVIAWAVVGQYLIQGDRLIAERALYQEWLQSRSSPRS